MTLIQLIKTQSEQVENLDGKYRKRNRNIFTWFNMIQIATSLHKAPIEEQYHLDRE